MVSILTNLILREALIKEIDNQGIRFETDVEIRTAGRGTLIDLLYKKVSRPQLINPTFITGSSIGSFSACTEK